MLPEALFLGVLVGATAFTSSDSVDRPRLSNTAVPIEYSLHLTPILPDFYSDSYSVNTFDGVVNIKMQALADTSKIELDVQDLHIINILCFLCKIESYSLDTEMHRLYIEFESKIVNGSIFNLEIKYAGKIYTDKYYGLFATVYDDVPKEHSNMVYATQFEASDARRVFPCFDEPAYKAIFELILTIPRTMRAVSNAQLLSSKYNLEDMVVRTFKKTERISTYLFAFAFGNIGFVRGEQHLGGRKLITRIWTHKDNVGKLSTALNSTQMCTRALTEYTEMPLTLEKIDHVAIGSFPGAMENYGLIVYDRTGVEFDPSKDDLALFLRQMEIQCHELAHHWFGDLVTNSWWDDLFLHESFATYMSNVAMQLAWPQHADFIDGSFVYKDVQRGLQFDDTAKHGVIADRAHFDEITYAKGGALLRQLSIVIGPEVMKDGLRRYLHKFAYANTDHNDLFTALQEAVDANGKVKDWCGDRFNVAAYLVPWLQQPHHPALHVSYYTQRDRFVITQSVANVNTNEPFGNQTWPMLLYRQTERGTSHKWFVPGFECPDGRRLPTKLIHAGSYRSSFLLNPKAELFATITYDKTSITQLKRDIAIQRIKPSPQGMLRLITDNVQQFATADEFDFVLSTKELRNDLRLESLRMWVVQKNMFPEVKRFPASLA